MNEASLQFVSWNHDEEPLKPGPQFTYPGITFGTSGFPLILHETHTRFVDRATWNVDSRGSHVLKAGVELSNIAASQTFPNNKDGTFNFLDGHVDAAEHGVDRGRLHRSERNQRRKSQRHRRSRRASTSTTSGAWPRTSRCRSACGMTPSSTR